MNGNGGQSSASSSGGGGLQNPYKTKKKNASTSGAATDKASQQETSHAAPPPPVAQPGGSNAQGTQDNYKVATKHIDECLSLKQYPLFEQLTAGHVVEQHMIGYLSMIWNWMARSTIVYRTKKDGDEMIMGKTTKEKHFKSIKAVFRHKFPNHEIWKNCSREKGKDSQTIAIASGLSICTTRKSSESLCQCIVNSTVAET